MGGEGGCVHGRAQGTAVNTMPYPLPLPATARFRALTGPSAPPAPPPACTAPPPLLPPYCPPSVLPLLGPLYRRHLPCGVSRRHRPRRAAGEDAAGAGAAAAGGGPQGHGQGPCQVDPCGHLRVPGVGVCGGMGVSMGVWLVGCTRLGWGVWGAVCVGGVRGGVCVAAAGNSLLRQPDVFVTVPPLYCSSCRRSRSITR